MDRWPAGASEGEPWDSFVRAREAFSAGDTAGAIRGWTAITRIPRLESRHSLQAWQFLRENGVQPPANKAKELLGVVIEVPMDGGLDLLAAYPERTARYYNYTGAGIVWERPNDSLDSDIDALLESAERILRVIGPWDKPRPAPPPVGNLRINILSPAGLHFGEGPFNLLAGDPMAKPTVAAATSLMQRLVSMGS